ncbi:acyl-CoA synthetase [Cupriavidus sp. TA19]|uniref:acetate--CoA ligase family protein n=1 Tax=unclassified Cupriavidus TaxID=2640874 RepID=UPI000E2F9ECC|nr:MULTISPECIES: acetate--CoA ligase family protein [unclassified Cupriavidus]BDB27489.1 acetate--CoA ligase family protein [Cupriavidus sp. P-10]GLC93857.1 acyl-CoA synthetase [Cupriavidus sp. TA19]
MSSHPTWFSDLSRLVNPRSIVLVGASEKPDSIGGRTLENLTTFSEFKGDLYLVNPGRAEIHGRPCVASVNDLKEAPDLAILAVRADMVLQTLRDCGNRGIRFAIVFTSGFGETGEDGRAVEAGMREIVASTGMRIYGPNCPGLNNMNARLGLTFSPAWRIDRRAGPIGVATQGGGLGRSFIQAMDRGVGVGLWCSGGNEVDLEVSDYIHYMADAPDIEVIVTTLEGVRNGPRFMAAALHAARRGKPIVAIKVGKSEYGAKAAQSHTAAIAGSAEINSAVFSQLGIIEVDDIDELIDVASLLARRKPTGKEQLAVYSFSGGTAALASDMVGLAGLKLSEFAPATIEALRNALPGFAAFSNPVDVTAEVLVNTEVSYATLKATAADPNTDLVLVPIPVEYGKTTAMLADSMVRVQSEETGTPIVPVWMSDRTGEGHRKMIDGGLMPMRAVGNAVLAIQRFIEYGRWKSGFEREWQPLANVAGTEATANLSEARTKALLEKAGIPTPRGVVARSPADAALAFRNAGNGKAVMKIVSAAITHKTDIGGVRLGIASGGDAMAAYEEIHANGAKACDPSRIEGVLVEPMLPAPFVEAVVGIHRDPVFGHVCTFGLGGVSIELFKDVSRRLLPLTPAAAREMVTETRCYELLKGYRGQPAFDIDALADMLVKLSDLVARHADSIEELEINPLAVRPQGEGVIALDAVLSYQGTEPSAW